MMESGESFQGFVMKCARAFGACIDMRDEPMDVPIPDKFEPSDYSSKRLREAELEVSRLLAMNEAEQEIFGFERRAEAIASAERALAKDREENARLLEMEARVSEWVPPSDDHEELKSFMLQQISVSKNNDDYLAARIAQLKAQDPIEFFHGALSEAQRSIEYHQEQKAKDIERAIDRTLWVRLLRESIDEAAIK